MDVAEDALVSRWTQVDGLPVHARVAEWPGAAASPPIVLVHGLLVSKRYMLPTARALAARWRVYAPDLPGYGQSAKLPRALDVQGLSDALAGYLRAAGLPRAALVANSFGCQVAADFAVRYPQHAECLVLLGPTVDPSSRPAVRLFVRWLLNIPLEPVSLNLVVLRDLLDMGVPRTWQTFQHMLRHHIERSLPHVQAPTLVVRGGRDTSVSQAWAEQAVCLLPHGRLAVVPGAAHTLNYNAPERVARLVDVFVHQTCETRETRLGSPS